jgi:hypothetical protein
MHGPPREQCCAVHFAFPAAECAARVVARVGHETIPHGHGERIVHDFARRLEPPLIEEGFGSVEVVASFEDAEALLRRWGANDVAA